MINVQYFRNKSVMMSECCYYYDNTHPPFTYHIRHFWIIKLPKNILAILRLPVISAVVWIILSKVSSSSIYFLQTIKNFFCSFYIQNCPWCKYPPVKTLQVLILVSSKKGCFHLDIILYPQFSNKCLYIRKLRKRKVNNLRPLRIL